MSNDHKNGSLRFKMSMGQQKINCGVKVFYEKWKKLMESNNSNTCNAGLFDILFESFYILISIIF